jgi:hypothetical protein
MKKLFAIALFLAAGIAKAADLNVTWTAPTSCSDSSAITNCPTTGYEIYMGTSATGTTYAKRAEAPAAADTNIVLKGILPGTRCLFMKTVSGAVVSAESNRICVNIPAVIPNAPVITVTIAVAM